MARRNSRNSIQNPDRPPSFFRVFARGPADFVMACMTNGVEATVCGCDTRVSPGHFKETLKKEGGLSDLGVIFILIKINATNRLSRLIFFLVVSSTISTTCV